MNSIIHKLLYYGWLRWIYFHPPVSSIRHVAGFVQRLWYYVPLLWRDRDWDHAYMLELMRLKLQRMEHFWHHGLYYTEPECPRKTIRETLEVLDRLVEQKYYEVGNADEANRKEDDDWNQLWQLFKKHMRSWWD